MIKSSDLYFRIGVRPKINSSCFFVPFLFKYPSIFSPFDLHFRLTIQVSRGTCCKSILGSPCQGLTLYGLVKTVSLQIDLLQVPKYPLQVIRCVQKLFPNERPEQPELDKNHLVSRAWPAIFYLLVEKQLERRIKWSRLNTK